MGTSSTSAHTRGRFTFRPHFISNDIEPRISRFNECEHLVANGSQPDLGEVLSCVSIVGDVYFKRNIRRVAMPVDLEKLQEEVKELTLELHSLQRAASSRRGPEGGRGAQGIPGERGPVGPAGTVSREQAIEMFREVVNDIFMDETLKNALKEVVEEIVSKTNFRLVRKTAV
jgi:uncharacterized protein (UPF0147 family)